MDTNVIAAEKAAAGRFAVQRIAEGMRIGMGSGSTVDAAIEALGERVRGGLTVRLCVASEHSAERARLNGLHPEPLDAVAPLAFVFDGADEVDAQFCLTKGGGGALVREKLLALAADELIIMVDETKRVAHLGAFPLPVAILPYGVEQTLARLRPFGEVTLRKQGEKPFLSDDHLYFADVRCGRIEDPAALERQLKSLPGVVEVGLFVGMTRRLIIGHADGTATEVAAV